MLISPIKNIEERQKLDIRAGDTIRVWQRIKEGDKTRRQAFEGLVIARKHGTEPGATFTVRKISEGIGVEITLPLFSPNIEKIELINRSKVRRAKLYFVRELAARAVKKKMKQIRQIGEVLMESSSAKVTEGKENEKEIIK